MKIEREVSIHVDVQVGAPFPWPSVFRIESKHEVTILGGLNEFVVKFFGPSGSKYTSSVHIKQREQKRFDRFYTS